MNLTQLMALGAGTLLVYSAITGKKPGEVFQALIAQSKTPGGTVGAAAGNAVNAAEIATGHGTVTTAASNAAQYAANSTAIARFN